MVTIRKFLAAGVCMSALTFASQAHAQWAVIDAANLLNTAKTVAQGLQQIEQLKQEVSQMENVYNSLKHDPMSALNQVGASMNTNSTIRLPLPTSASSMATLLNGTDLGSMGTVGQQYHQQNLVAAPTGDDFQATQMTSNANSIAGVQAAADQLHTSSTSHIQALQGLETELANSPDDKATADISARVQLESTYLSAQQVQATTLQTWQEAQVRNQHEQAEEAKRENIDDVIAEADQNGGGS